MGKKLTTKQKVFVKEYLVDLNATQAAIRAGYSARTADRTGPALLGNSCVSDAIQKAMRKREQRTEITSDMVLKQLAKIAFLDIKNVVEWNDQGVKIRNSDEVDGTVLTEVSETYTEGGWTKKVKMSDRMKALELLGKHLGIFNDKLKVDIDASLAEILLKSWNDDE